MCSHPSQSRVIYCIAGNVENIEIVNHYEEIELSNSYRSAKVVFIYGSSVLMELTQTKDSILL